MVVLVIVAFVVLGKGTALDNIKNIGETIKSVSKQLNNKISDILGSPSNVEILGELPNPLVKVHMLDIGQGDSFLVETQEGNILVDSGETAYSQQVINYLRSAGIDKLELVVASHPHSDHIGGLADIVNNFEIGQIIMPDIPDSLIPTTRCFTNLLEAIESKDLGIFIASPGGEYSFGEKTTLTILGPVGETDNLNDTSIVARLDCDEVSFLFTGDVESGGEKAIVESGQNLRVDVLAVAHHGSNTSTTKDFLAKVKPRVAIISCGLENGYGHPHREVVESLSDMGAEIYRTDLDGTVVLETDGKKLAIITELERGEKVA